MLKINIEYVKSFFIDDKNNCANIVNDQSSDAYLSIS